MEIELTLITKSGRRAILSKVISLSPDGTIVSDPSHCVLSRGTAQRVQAGTAAQLADLIMNCSSSQAIALGRLKSDLPMKVDLATKRKFKEGKTFPRTRDYIDYEDGQPAWCLIDFDTKGMPPEVRSKIDQAGGVWLALLKVAPELAGASRVSRGSTSSGLFNKKTGEEYQGNGGAHHYILVKNGADIERFIRDLHARCWLAGFGWHMVSKSGQLLERSLVDRFVAGGERLCFEGAPLVKAPLAQDASKRVAESYEGQSIDTTTTAPPLKDDEIATLQKLEAESASLLQATARSIRQKFDNDLVEKVSKERKLPLEMVRRFVASRHRNILMPCHMLEFDDQGLYSVEDVLEDPDRFCGETLADPFEGPEYGRCKAMILKGDDGTLLIHSFAHGRQIYLLRHDLRSALLALEKSPAEGVVDFAMCILVSAELEADEIEQFTKAIAKKANIGPRGVGQRIKKELAKKQSKRSKHTSSTNSRITRPRPLPDEELLPTVTFLDALLSKDDAERPPMRDSSGNLVEIRERAPWSMHLLTSSGSNAEDDANRDPEKSEAPPEPTLMRLTATGVELMVERYVGWKVGDDEDYYYGALPRPHIDALMQFPQSGMPIVHSINTAPLVGYGGEVIDGHGLDRRTGLFHIIPPSTRAALPSSEPTTEEVKEAIRFLVNEWLVDVALPTAGKLIAVMMALTLLQRALLPERPAFFVTAGQRGGGKTTLVSMVVQATLGRRPAAASWSGNSEERKKALFSYMRQGGSCLVWDNVPRGSPVSCPHIEAALTAPEVSDRVLGESRTETVPSTTVQIFTGNAILARGDLASRSLVLPLSVDRPDPENRSFVHAEPLTWTEENRLKILRALYVILVAGGLNRPKEQKAKTRFKTWWHLVGWPVEFAASQIGLTLDCTELMRAGEAGDEEANSVSAALSTLREIYHDMPFTSRDLLKLIEPATDPWAGGSLDSIERIHADTVLAALSELNGKNLYRPNAQQIGKLLQKTLVGRPGWVGDGKATAVLKKKEGHNENSYTVVMLDGL